MHNSKQSKYIKHTLQRTCLKEARSRSYTKHITNTICYTPSTFYMFVQWE